MSGPVIGTCLQNIIFTSILSRHVFITIYFLGKEISRIDTNTAGRTCGFSYSGNLVLCTTDKAMGHPCQLMVFDKRDDQQIRKALPYLINGIRNKMHVLLFNMTIMFILLE